MEGEREKFEYIPFPDLCPEPQPPPAPFVLCNVTNQPLLSKCKLRKSNNNLKIILKVCFHKVFSVSPQGCGELLAVLHSLQSVCVCVSARSTQRGLCTHPELSTGTQGLGCLSDKEDKKPKPEFSLTQASICPVKLSVAECGCGRLHGFAKVWGRGRAEERSRLFLLLLALISSLWLC